MGNNIDFANDILKNEKKIKGKPIVYYSPRKYKNTGSYDILIDICEHVTLVQLMDYLGNMNNDISVVGYWIFYLNYEKTLLLNIEYLDMICAPYIGEEQVSEFETVFTTVR